MISLDVDVRADTVREDGVYREVDVPARVPGTLAARAVTGSVDGARNAALLVVWILALADSSLAARPSTHRETLAAASRAETVGLDTGGVAG